MTDDHQSSESLQRYLHEHIPLTAAMGVRVRRADIRVVELEAPLEPNRNHKGGGFGGSIATLALTAAWATVHLQVRDRLPRATVVVADQQVEFRRPVTGTFRARCVAPGPADWKSFDATLAARGRGRIELTAQVECDGELVAQFQGRFVALAAS